MSKTAKSPLPNPVTQVENVDFDEHHGKGGSYIKDPVTGQRVLQERTQAAKAPAIESKE